MENIKNIILDYGDVIYRLDFHRVHQAFTDLGVKNVEEFFSHAQQDPIFDAFDKGECSAVEFRNHIREVVGQELSFTDRQIDDAWNALLCGIIPGSHELLIALKNHGYRLFLLSNNNELHYAYILNDLKQNHQIANNDVFFEACYYSHLVGMRKPEKELFQLVLDNHQLLADQTLFIDDSPQHLASAESLGIKTALCSREHTLSQIIYQNHLL